MTTSFHPPPPTPTRIDLTGMMEEAVEAENMEDKKLRHMSKDDQALAKLGYKSECKSSKSKLVGASMIVIY
ncbi:hypothetical protein PGT21_008859 [Puccinia graminis f. sp. tritici]|uniref:Uncharacterized protein n=1 Tax=Puccinia graminis f. sp. tritici TaxID=56615 RepID=A0A5B0QMY6_PUCGR|nr:hypothetical protein PGT21_008859 [Puccinia graminis f. sp. tritici]KAA1124280.1 hypothetical protein PGTUg99_022141 [Puccinia graminis f. sp. tritici]